MLELHNFEDTRSSRVDIQGRGTFKHAGNIQVCEHRTVL